MIYLPNPRNIWSEIREHHIKARASIFLDLFDDLRLGYVANHSRNIPKLQRGDGLYVDPEHETRVTHDLPGRL